MITRRNLLKLFGVATAAAPFSVSAVFNEETAKVLTGEPDIKSNSHMFEDVDIRINTDLGPLKFNIKTFSKYEDGKIQVYAVEDLCFSAKKDFHIQGIDVTIEVPGVGDYQVDLHIQPVDVFTGADITITFNSQGILHLH